MFDIHDDRFGYGFDLGRAAAPAPPTSPSASTTVPLSSITSWDEFIGNSATRGLSADRAMRHGAVYACVRVIGGTLAQLPFKTYRAKRDGTTVEARNHPAAKLLRVRPNPRMSAVMFWRTVLSQALLPGNGYAWIERSRNGVPLALWPLPKSRVSAMLSTSGATKGRIIYALTLDDSAQITVDMDDMLHIPGSMEWNGLEAKSPLQAAASAVNVGLEANEYAQRYFENDATPPTYLAYKNKVTAQLANSIREEWGRKGAGENRHKIRVVSEGGEVHQLEISAEDAQLLESRKFAAEDIARIFGVPPHMIGAVEKTTSWGTGIEQQAIGFVTFTLGMHIAAIEQELEAKIFRDDGHHCEIDVRGLMRGDFKTRNEGYRQALGGSGGPGYMTPNEVRKLENLAPKKGADELQKFTPKGTGNESSSAAEEPAGDDAAGGGNEEAED